MKKIIVPIVFALVIVLLLTLLYLTQREHMEERNHYSGVLEATREARLAFQTGGKVQRVLVEEGQRVGAGELLAVLDPEELDSRRIQAKKAYQKAMDSLKQAEALLKTYETTIPSELKRAQANRESALKVMEDAQRNLKRFEALYERKVVAEKDRDAARLHYDTARANLEAADAIVKQAQGNLGKIEASRHEVAALKAQVEQTREMLNQVVIQRSYTELRAPFAGIITSRNCEPGEVVTPTREVLTISDLSSMDLKIFVEETEIGKVKPGQKVDVKIDTFPGRIFPGVISYISPVGEFTPKIIQTRKERVKLVYLVKVKIPNPDLSLKTGLPADAWLKP